MIGAIIGDIVGSRFEGHLTIPEGFDFIDEKCHFTDDTVHTLAIAKAIKERRETGERLNELSVKYLREIGRRYLWCGCGDFFYKWLFTSDPKPYGSYGNGAAMRVSSCAWFADSLEQALDYAEIVTSITHNNDEAIMGAKAVTEAIWLARQHIDKTEIQNTLITDGLYFPYDFKSHKFDITCKGTVNIALHAFMEGESFEDVIRTAVMYGGDTDTNAAIAGSIAEPYYNVTEKYEKIVLEKLDDFLRELYIEVNHPDLWLTP